MASGEDAGRAGVDVNERMRRRGTRTLLLLPVGTPLQANNARLPLSVPHTVRLVSALQDATPGRWSWSACYSYCCWLLAAAAVGPFNCLQSSSMPATSAESQFPLDSRDARRDILTLRARLDACALVADALIPSDPAFVGLHHVSRSPSRFQSCPSCSS